MGYRLGDVLNGSRRGYEERHLKAAYQAIYQAGTMGHSEEFYQTRETGRDIILTHREKSIAGLQLADLLAHPAKQRCLARHGVAGVVEGDFGRQLAGLFWTRLGKQKEDDSCAWGEVFLA